MTTRGKAKIHILFEFKSGPWGGGNQFLKGLKNQLIKLGTYEENCREADVVLFNSHHNLKQVLALKRKHQNKILIHRIDGPILKIRDEDSGLDRIIYQFNNFLADGTIFQSNWSKRENYKLGMERNRLEAVILNAPDNSIFNKRDKSPFKKNQKIKLIATSWSDNWKKGFEIYQYLDENLDFRKYEMTFIGNSPINFRNIRWIKPLSSKGVAKQLKKHDIFITASQKDPCSNSLIEALHCGLPAIVLNDGGHPEIVRSGGEIFEEKKDVLSKIDKIAQNYKQYQKAIRLPSMEKIAKEYYQFAQKIFNDYQKKAYIPKKINLLQQGEIALLMLYQKIKNRQS
jgi:glycosyltransferase involved in cell wall biosynthesis